MVNTFTVGQVAERLSVTAPTVRNWSTRYASHLSETANPPTGTERLYTERDVNVLVYVGQCVAEKMRHDDIAHKLASTSFGDVLEVENATEPPESEIRSNHTSDAPIAPHSPASTVDYAPVLYDLSVLVDSRHDETVRRLDKLERQRHGVIMLAAGVAIGVALVTVALLLLRVL